VPSGLGGGLGQPEMTTNGGGAPMTKTTRGGDAEGLELVLVVEEVQGDVAELVGGLARHGRERSYAGARWPELAVAAMAERGEQREEARRKICGTTGVATGAVLSPQTGL
jgi:hypothetical protein